MEVVNMEGYADISDALNGFQLALIVIFWCFQMEETSGRSHDDKAVGENYHPAGTRSNATELFQAIEQLCAENGVLERSKYLVHGSRNGRASSSLCMIYADVLDSLRPWGFASILCGSLRSLAYILMARRSLTDVSPPTAVMDEKFLVRKPVNEFNSTTIQGNRGVNVWPLSPPLHRTSYSPNESAFRAREGST